MRWRAEVGRSVPGRWSQLVGRSNVASNDPASFGPPKACAISARWTKLVAMATGMNSGGSIKRWQCTDAPHSRLLIIEMVLPAGDTPHPGKMLDMMMLVGPGGLERTEQEYGTLLAKAKLRLTRLVRTESPVSIIEARVS